MKVLLKKLNSEAKLPTQSLDDVGFDVYAADFAWIEPGKVGKVSTGIVLAADPGVFKVQPKRADAPDMVFRSLLKVEGRSGMASRGVWPVGGIVDPGYRGEIMIALYNSTRNVYKIEPGDRIAQLVWYPVIAKHDGQWGEEVGFEWTEEIDESERGDSGFGSSGA